MNSPWISHEVTGCAAVHRHPTTTTAAAARRIFFISSCPLAAQVVFWISYKGVTICWCPFPFGPDSVGSSSCNRQRRPEEEHPREVYYGGGRHRQTERRQRSVNMFEARGIPFILLDIACLVLGMCLNDFIHCWGLCVAAVTDISRFVQWE